MATRALLTAATGSSIDDSCCSLAWGSKLAASVGDAATAGVLRGDDSGLVRPTRSSQIGRR